MYDFSKLSQHGITTDTIIQLCSHKKTVLLLKKKKCEFADEVDAVLHKMKRSEYFRFKGHLNSENILRAILHVCTGHDIKEEVNLAELVKPNTRDAELIVRRGLPWLDAKRIADRKLANTELRHKYKTPSEFANLATEEEIKMLYAA